MKKIGGVLLVSILGLGSLSFLNKVTEIIDLTNLGIPVSVDAPNGAQIVAGVGNGLNDGVVNLIVWEVNKGDFSLEIYMDNDEMYQEAAEYVALSKELAEDNDFNEYVLEETNGFIYKYTMSNEIYYGCYYLLVKNGRAIEFSTGMDSDDTNLDNVKAIYAAAKSGR